MACKETMANQAEEKNRKRLLRSLNRKTSKPSHKYSLKSCFALFKDLDQYFWEVFPESYMHLHSQPLPQHCLSCPFLFPS